MRAAIMRRAWRSRAIALLCAPLLIAASACSSTGSVTTAATSPAPAAVASAPAPDLPSWRDGPAKDTITRFVTSVTTYGAATYVPPDLRVAVFDNDGTLWSEQPLYFQFLFMIEQVREQAPKHPEWQKNPAFAPLMKGDHAALADKQKPLLQLLAAANSGMSVDDYDVRIRTWLANARHPRFARPFTELTYQPQKELLAYLRANGFKTYIVSGGNTEFMRPWAESAYGIPPEQVIGTVQGLKLSSVDGQPQLVREPKVDFVDDGPGKPVAIYRSIGRQPILAVGNSDGDLQMLEYTTRGVGPRLAILIHHDDAAREYAYDRKSQVGKLDRAWDEAIKRGWTVVSMKDDWREIFAPPSAPSDHPK
ncbi:HAD family hydrolase [Pandoraea norimbergensis]|uniref:HAD family hydrolase n=1 Tax=Pandoraea norimbergensis TaxID=93219 RepID=A0ABN4JP32_9BURK|nr:HAD family hydrolase [Pandoraea norimbergensis]ALS61763.1 HAD family hydrolase [Pandoraea norimbergensis]